MPTSKSAASKDGTPLAEQFFGQVSESIQLVFDLTSRIDERVKMLIERQKEIDDQLEKLLDMQQHALHRLTHLEAQEFAEVKDDLHALNAKIAVIESDEPEYKLEIEQLKQKTQDLRNIIHVLELKMESVHMRVGNHDTRWTKIFDAFWKVMLMLIAGYILFKLGLQAPPN